MVDSTLTSLSDFHDYEPDLEFDDSWMVEAANSPAPTVLEAFAETETVMPHSASDGTIEENFEEELALPRSYEECLMGLGPSHTEPYLQIATGEVERYSRLVRAGFLEVAGEDQSGCLIVIIRACNLPPTNEVAPDIVLKYLVFTLDKFVESDYSIIYLHHGLRNESRPPFVWFWGAYKLLERKFKKNLKGLYLVHPTQMVKIIWKMLRPLISAKFGKKLKPCYHLHELRSNFRLDQLPIPESVLEYDRQLLANDPKAASAAAAALSAEASRSNASASTTAPPPTKGPAPVPTQQIGVSLEFIREHNPDMQDSIPPIVRYCVEFLSKPESLATEGIFRRSMAVTTLTRMVAECNRGEEVNFNNDPHCAAMLLKAFLRELEEPILTHQLFDEIFRFNSWPIPQRPRMTKILLLERLPLENYKLLKYIIQFLWRVADMSCLNKMTASNLAVVFGPNLLWPSEGGQFSLNFVIPINQFTEYILQHQEDLFII